MLNNALVSLGAGPTSHRPSVVWVVQMGNSGTWGDFVPYVSRRKLGADMSSQSRYMGLLRRMLPRAHATGQLCDTRVLHGLYFSRSARALIGMTLCVRVPHRIDSVGFVYFCARRYLVHSRLHMYTFAPTLIRNSTTKSTGYHQTHMIVMTGVTQLDVFPR